MNDFPLLLFYNKAEKKRNQKYTPCKLSHHKKKTHFFLFFFQVVELLLARGANKEHRNVSDYTPLSLAASGGYVNIIKILLNAGAEINSRQVLFSLSKSLKSVMLKIFVAHFLMPYLGNAFITNLEFKCLKLVT